MGCHRAIATNRHTLQLSDSLLRQVKKQLQLGVVESYFCRMWMVHSLRWKPNLHTYASSCFALYHHWFACWYWHQAAKRYVRIQIRSRTRTWQNDNVIKAFTHINRFWYSKIFVIATFLKNDGLNWYRLILGRDNKQNPKSLGTRTAILSSLLLWHQFIASW